MDYGKIIRRSVELVWQNKFLIGLGMLVALGSGTSSGFSNSGSSDFSGSSNGEQMPFPTIPEEYADIAVVAIIAFALVAFALGLIFWAVSSIARGGLIAGVDTLESGGKSSFGAAWRAGWDKVWSLLGIGLLPAIPVFFMFLLGLVVFWAYGGFSALMGEPFSPPDSFAIVGVVMALVACVVLPVALFLSILRTFAERACMLEDLGAFDAYRRGWEVLRRNIGEAVVLFLVQIVISIGLGVVLFLPSLLLALCCFLWPLLLAMQGTIVASVSSVWTMAWREWTGTASLKEKAPAGF